MTGAVSKPDSSAAGSVRAVAPSVSGGEAGVADGAGNGGAFTGAVSKPDSTAAGSVRAVAPSFSGVADGAPTIPYESNIMDLHWKEDKEYYGEALWNTPCLVIDKEDVMVVVPRPAGDIQTYIARELDSRHAVLPFAELICRVISAKTFEHLQTRDRPMLSFDLPYPDNTASSTNRNPSVVYWIANSHPIYLLNKHVRVINENHDNSLPSLILQAYKFVTQLPANSSLLVGNGQGQVSRQADGPQVSPHRGNDIVP